MQIYPSILETSPANFEMTIKKLFPVFSHFQIDISDGLFVPEKTVQINELDFNRDTINLKNKTFEFHLMVNDYEKEITGLKKYLGHIKITRVFIHLKVYSGAVPESEFQYGLALNPEDEVAANMAIIKRFPAVQIMTVNPGRQGNPFLTDALEKITELRQFDYPGNIILDGGINDKTLPMILAQKNRPDAVCPGSFFKEEPAKKLQLLRKIIAG